MELRDVYERIEQNLGQNLRSADINLSKSILSWVVCSERQLNEVELGEALRPKFSVLSLRHTISRLCGDFVVIDKKGNISTVHHTAKDFLLKSATSMALAVNPGESHTFIFDKCLATLADPRFRLRLKIQGCTGFIRYSCLSWQYHMARSDELGHSHGFIRRLGSFLRSTASTSSAPRDSTRTRTRYHSLSRTWIFLGSGRRSLFAWLESLALISAKIRGPYIL